MPWEDQNEFEELQRQLFEEHQPEGPLQEDCAKTIAFCLWRKERVKAKRHLDTVAELDRIHNRVLWADPPPYFDTQLESIKHFFSNKRPRESTRPRDDHPQHRDDYQQLLGFSSRLYGDLHLSLVKFSIDRLPKEYAEHLQKKIPFENFDSVYDWVFAIKSEVDNVLLPMLRGREPQSSNYAAVASSFLTNERILEDLEIEERLNAHIDRAMKRLFMLQMGSDLRKKRETKTVGGSKLNQIEHHRPLSGAVDNESQPTIDANAREDT